MQQPWTYQFGRDYYDAARDPTEIDWPTYTSEEPSDYYKDQFPLSRTAAVGAGAAALGALGFKRLSSGKRIWDYYALGARAIEEYSPGHILRTFQVAPILSQFEAVNQREIALSSSFFQQNTNFQDYMAKLIGGTDTAGALNTRGVTLRSGKLYWGVGEGATEVALEHAAAIRQAPKAASWIGRGWAMAVGADPEKSWQYFFTSPSELKPLDTEGFVTQIIGGKTRREYAGRWASAYGTEMMGRFNRLLKAPAGFPIVGDIFDYAQTKAEQIFGVKEVTLGVKEGTGGQMLGRFMKKYGVALPLAYAGYKTLDWMMDDSILTKHTIFSEGLTTGLATIGVKANQAVSKIAELTGAHWYREKQEEIAPGSTSLTKLLAFPLMGALGAEAGLYGIKAGMMLKKQITEKMSPTAARIAVEKSMESFGEGTGAISRFARYVTSQEGLYKEAGWLGNFWRKVAYPAMEAGVRAGEKASPAKYGGVAIKGYGRLTPAKFAGGLGVLAGLAVILPFLPGALVPSERPEELEDIYSGRKEVAIRGGRWWEFGRSAFEGNKINYFRPHWYARMRMDAREKGIWGDEAKSLSPISKWFKEEFTYDLEREHYYDRPYPITALPFEDVPILGPLIANTIGRIIKPPKLMHTEEWQGEGGSQLSQPPRYGDRIATEIGEKYPGKAITPYDATGTAGEQIYRMTELVGLPGFMESTVKEALTGSGDWFDQVSRLESSRRMFGFERKYWDLELGGLAGTTEAFRRLYPHRRRQIPLYNPIRNTMPEWLPGPGEKSPDFLHGDPYTKVPEGELRLPGRGYEARFPELEGINPADYPLIHRFKILADVAPYSTQFGETNRIVQAARNTPNWTENEEATYQETKRQEQERKQKKTFSDYQYLSPMGNVFGERQEKWGSGRSSELIASLNRQAAEKTEEKGIFSKLFGGYWELLSHNAETTAEQLTPMSPAAKLIHQRTAIEDYERMQLYGTENAFWNHPVRDFLRPTKWLAAHALGFEGTPTHVEQKRNLEEYFDILKYVKASRLANMARLNKDFDATREFENMKDKTLFGINPFTRNFSSIFNALPRAERDYFNAFVDSKTPEEREKVLQMVPENEKALYIARWKVAFGDEVQKAARQGKLNDKALGQAEKLLTNIAKEATTEGMPVSEQLQAEYWKERSGGESYADWYRRKYLLSALPSLPGPDWVGWHPAVDLDDIKLKVVQTIGEDMHSYDLWQTQAQALAQKPYINEAAVAPILEEPTLSRQQMHARIDELMMTNKIKGAAFSRTSFGSNRGTQVSVQIDQEPDQDLMRSVLGYGQ